MWFTLPKEQQSGGREYMMAGKVQASTPKTVDVLSLQDNTVYSLPAANVKHMAQNSIDGVLACMDVCVHVLSFMQCKHVWCMYEL